MSFRDVHLQGSDEDVDDVRANSEENATAPRATDPQHPQHQQQTGTEDLLNTGNSANNGVTLHSPLTSPITDDPLSEPGASQSTTSATVQASERQGGTGQQLESQSEGPPSDVLAPSSAQLRYQEMDLDNISIDVKFPLKHGDGRRAYASYTIETQVKRDGPFKASSMSVQRRYSHFVWLRSHLARAVPGRIVPPVPPKHDFNLNKFDQHFLETRRSGLERFLRRVAAHSVLCHNAAFVAFLEMKAHEFETYMNDNAADTRETLASSLQAFGSSFAERDLASRYGRERETQQETEKSTRRLADVSARSLTNAREDLKLQRELAVGFRAFAESDDDMKLACETMADGLERVGNQGEQFLSHIDKEFVQPMQDIALYPHAVMEALQWRAVQEVKRKRLEHQLAAKQEELAKIRDSDHKASLGAIFGKDPAEVKKEKTEKLSQQMNELSEAVDTARDKETVANATMDSDLDRHHEVQEVELRRLLSVWAEHEVTRYNHIQDAWTGVVASLEQQLESLEAQQCQDAES